MRSLTKRTLIVYPNIGGHFDPKACKWVDVGMDTPESFAREAMEWKKYGNPIIIGGCCKTHFKWIQELSNQLRDKKKTQKLSMSKLESQITNYTTVTEGGEFSPTERTAKGLGVKRAQSSLRSL